MSSSRHRLPCESIHCLLLLYIKTNGGCPLPSKERLIAMKHWWKRAVYACILCLCLCCTACSANSQPDPAVLLRETLSQVNALESCESRFSNDLEFNAGTEQQTFHSAVSSVYFADPFCLKSTQDTGAGAPSVTYTMTEDASAGLRRNRGRLAPHPGGNAQHNPFGTDRNFAPVKAGH